MLIIQANNIHESGARYLLLSLLNCLMEEKADQRVTVFLDTRFDRSQLAGLIDSGRLSVIGVESTTRSRLWSEYSLARLTKRHRGSTVLCLGNIPPLFPCSANVVLYLQTVLYFRAFRKYLDGFRLRLKLAIEGAWIRWRIRSVDRVLVQSCLVAELLRQEYGIGIDMVKVLPFADLEGLRAKPSGGSAAAKSGFFYPALGTPHKNHEKLIDAWVLLAREEIRPPLLLTIDPRFGRLLEHLEKAKRESRIDVVNLGLVSHRQVLSQMSAAQAMIFPSLCESFGLPLLEARENGVPVIAGELDYVREILDPVETFDPESALSIARAVKRFLGLRSGAIELATPADLVDLILGSSQGTSRGIGA